MLEEVPPAINSLLLPKKGDFLAPLEVVLDCALVATPAVKGLVPVDARPFAAEEGEDDDMG